MMRYCSYLALEFAVTLVEALHPMLREAKIDDVVIHGSRASSFVNLA
jgi:hypothetical protein